ncbi:PspC domain-containing protein [Fontibacillus panacisegetis]|nr:PspC domain-containing protein [Fontibacillus panacisegetis]
MKKRLHRIREGKMIAGVCGGIAKYFDVNPKVVRLLWAVFFAAYGSGLVAYILFSIFVPKEPKNFLGD